MAMPATFDPLIDFDGLWTTRSVEVELLKLADGRYEPLAGAAGGQEFAASEPFAIRFIPRDLAP